MALRDPTHHQSDQPPTDPALLVALTEQLDGVEPDLLVHANGAEALRSVTVLVADAAADAEALSGLLGCPAFQDDDSWIISFANDSTIELTEQPIGGWERAGTGSRRPWVLGPSVEVSDPERLAHLLRDTDVEIVHTEEATLAIGGPGAAAVRFTPPGP